MLGGGEVDSVDRDSLQRRRQIYIVEPRGRPAGRSAAVYQAAGAWLRDYMVRRDLCWRLCI